MTEAEWLACDDPEPMLALARGWGAGERKLRLFAVACVGHVWCLLPEEPYRRLVGLVERAVDGRATAGEVTAAAGEAVRRALDLTARPRPAKMPRSPRATRAGTSGSRQRTSSGTFAGPRATASVPGSPATCATSSATRSARSPSPPVWRTDTVRALAAQMY